MINRLILTAAAIASCFTLNAQTLQPVKWEFTSETSRNKEVTIYLKANIDKGFRLNSLFDRERGPIKTTIVFEPSNDYKLVGKIQQPNPKVVWNDPLRVELSYFETEVTFKQKIRLRKKRAEIRGYIEYVPESDWVSIFAARESFNITVQLP